MAALQWGCLFVNQLVRERSARLSLTLVYRLNLEKLIADTQRVLWQHWVKA